MGKHEARREHCMGRKDRGGNKMYIRRVHTEEKRKEEETQKKHEYREKRKVLQDWQEGGVKLDLYLPPLSFPPHSLLFPFTYLPLPSSILPSFLSHTHLLYFLFHVLSFALTFLCCCCTSLIKHISILSFFLIPE